MADQTATVPLRTLPTRPPAFRFVLNLRTVHQAHAQLRPTPLASMHFLGPFTSFFWGGRRNLLAILVAVGIVRLVAFEFVPGVGRGLNGYSESLQVESR